MKNNLQLLSSIFSLQSRLVRDKDALDAVKSGENRVNAMAIIHQKLYRQSDARTINVKDYLTELICELAESYGIDSGRDSLRIKIDNLELDVDKVIPMGLIVNELVNNAFKYAFPQSENPKLTVLLERNDGCLSLSVEDNGKGFQKKESRTSMGVNIIETLARQLGAKLHWDTSQGVKFRLNLDLKVSSSWKKIKVLLVEDELLIAQDLKARLEDHEFEVMAICRSGEDALTEVRMKAPDLILMDIHLDGELDGIETATQIVERYDIPIIYLSDHTDQETVDRAKQTFPANYLSKPYKGNDLLRALELAFANAKHQKLKKTSQ